MQKTDYDKEKEENALLALVNKEELVEKKAKIYAKLLMEPRLSKEMEELASRHEKRKELLLKLVTGKEVKNKKEGGMYEMKEEKKE